LIDQAHYAFTTDFPDLPGLTQIFHWDVNREIQVCALLHAFEKDMDFNLRDAAYAENMRSVPPWEM
jgi:hypothetical protein